MEMHGSRRPKVVAETALGMVGWQSLHNWLLRMILIYAAAVISDDHEAKIQSLTQQQPSLRSSRTGILSRMLS